MREIVRYVKQYIINIDRTVFFLATLFTGILVWYNYDYGLDQLITTKVSLKEKAYYRYLIFFTAFIVPYLLFVFLRKRNYYTSPLFIVFVLLAPAMFALKMVVNTDLDLRINSEWLEYWNQVLYWPLRMMMIVIILLLIWFIAFREENFFGVTTKVEGIVKRGWWKPYLLLLIIMVPLVALASTQADFLQTYPKLKQVEAIISEEPNSWFYRLLFELSYGTDFITIELFFRGFLVLGLMKLVGKDCIIPMACFYCTIHFGKPLGECISSYFGGLLLGIIVYNSRSIIGGLMVHLGIAWLMELGGFIGNMIKNATNL